VWRIVRLEYVFDGWLGDDLLTSHPRYIVTEVLARELTTHELTGVRLTDVLISKSDLFEQLHPERQLPMFRGLIPDGKASVGDDVVVQYWSGHDLCLTERAQLVETRNTLEILRQHHIDHRDIDPLRCR
jgi:hypothetical protein